MADENNSPQVIVEVPTERGNFSPLPTAPQQSRVEAFRRGWGDALALPDNLTDLLFDLTASVAVPALVSSAWSSLPLPEFVRAGGVVAVAITFLFLWHLLELPAVRGVLLFRLALVTLGVVLGL